ncbi:MAG TPA: c-type cytochrome [Paracoccaceae bacterium]|nr:c-type cytochrome [Paracoccaceae bacterium]
MTWNGKAAAAAGAVVGMLGLPAGGAADPSGALIAAVCANCHADVATEAGAIPSFSGLTGADLAAALARFRDGADDATIMTRIARGLTPADVAALAAHVDATRKAAP